MSTPAILFESYNLVDSVDSCRLRRSWGFQVRPADNGNGTELPSLPLPARARIRCCLRYRAVLYSNAAGAEFPLFACFLLGFLALAPPLIHHGSAPQPTSDLQLFMCVWSTFPSAGNCCSTRRMRSEHKLYTVSGHNLTVFASPADND